MANLGFWSPVNDAEQEMADAAIAEQEAAMYGVEQEEADRALAQQEAEEAIEAQADEVLAMTVELALHEDDAEDKQLAAAFSGALLEDAGEPEFDEDDVPDIELTDAEEEDYDSYDLGEDEPEHCECGCGGLCCSGGECHCQEHDEEPDFADYDYEGDEEPEIDVEVKDYGLSTGVGIPLSE